MGEKLQFIGELHGTREGWPKDMSEDEARVMSEHFVYLRQLTWLGKVLLAGPVDMSYGLIALETENKEEAETLLAADPSVRAGLHTYTLKPFVASLLHGRARYSEQPGERSIDLSVDLPAPRADVWQVWTTADGLQSFFAPEVNMELRVGGPFEILFAPPDASLGERGGEGCRVLAYTPGEMLAFSWNAPPHFAAIRSKRTQVTLFLQDTESGGTRLRLVNHGYGSGQDWDPVFEYFEGAWPQVFECLKRRFPG